MKKTGIPSLNIEEYFEDDKRWLEISFYNSTQEDVELRVFNSFGEPMFEEILPNSECIVTKLDVSSLKKGEYSLSISNTNIRAYRLFQL